MTALYVLGSGSRGNCCAVECDGAAVMIDAGFSPREIERRAAARIEQPCISLVRCGHVDPYAQTCVSHSPGRPGG